MSSCSCPRAPDGPCSLECSAVRDHAFTVGQRSWPQFQLSREQFEEHLARAHCSRPRLPHAPALYLCAACTLGVEPALRALERLHLVPLQLSIARRLRDRDRVDDVLQELRHRLLVGPAPKIATYRGIGSFPGWLRIIAINLALDHRREARVRRRRHARLNDDPSYVLETWDSAAAPPDDEVIRSRSSQLCERALCRAIQQLGTEQRHLLRLHFVGGASIDTLGELYGVDRSTAARRIQRSIAELRRSMQAQLATHSDAPPASQLEDLLASSRSAFQLEAAWLQSGG